RAPLCTRGADARVAVTQRLAPLPAGLGLQLALALGQRLAVAGQLGPLAGGGLGLLAAGLGPSLAAGLGGGDGLFGGGGLRATEQRGAYSAGGTGCAGQPTG